LEEKAVLLPLPKNRYRITKMQGRKISPDNFVSINSNKYSVPVMYVGKTVQFRIVYGFRIMLCDRKGNFIMSFEKADKKHETFSNSVHYEAIAPKFSTSISQVRRDFTQGYSNGARYLETAGLDMREQYSDIINEAEQNAMGYMEFLVHLLSIEEEGKNARRLEMLLGKANFDSTATLNDIDYSFNHTLDKERIAELGKLHFLKEHQNVIIIVPPGVVKSMVATGIGINACHAGHSVLFVNARKLVNKLYEEMTAGRLPKMLGNLRKIDLLIIDVPMGRWDELFTGHWQQQRFLAGCFTIVMS